VRQSANGAGIYEDDFKFRAGYYGSPVGTVKTDFILQNEDGDRLSFQLGNTYFYVLYTRNNRLYTTSISTNITIKKNQWYYLSLNFDLKKSFAKFEVYDNDEDRLLSVGLDSFYNISEVPSIFHFKNVSAGFHYQVDQYDYTQTLLIDYLAAPFVIFDWAENFQSANSSDFQSLGAYGVAVNGSTSSDDKIVYYTNYIDHFQAYTGMIKAELDEANDSADSLKTDITVYSVNPNGGTGTGHMAKIVLTVSGFSGGKADLEIKIYTPATSVIKNFANVARGTVGFLFWRNPSSNKFWVKAALWDETNNLNKTLLQLANTLPEDDTNEYMIQQMFIYKSNDSKTNGQTLIFDSEIVRSLAEVQEPILPWPDKPPVPPPRMDWFASVISAIIGFILSPFFWLFDNVVAPLIEWILDAINDLLSWVGGFIFEWLGIALDWILDVVSDIIDALASIIFAWWDANNLPNILALVEDIFDYMGAFVDWLIKAVTVFVELAEYFQYIPIMFLIGYWMYVLLIPAASCTSMGDFFDKVFAKLSSRLRLSVIIGVDVPIVIFTLPATLIELLVVTA
ncbi:MAG: hypothetical protein ACTSR2_03020, partial [Candidatus Hodarchaeales archaeon]